jgi:hypothetical protein
MARRAVIGSLLRCAVLFLAVVNLAFHALPTGAKICHEASGSLALEAESARCCDVSPLNSEATLEANACDACVDYRLPGDRNARPQDRDIKAVTGPVDASAVIAILAWPQPVAPRSRHWSCPASPPALRAQIASIVIRC